MKDFASIKELIVEFHCNTFILFIENYPGVYRRFGHRSPLHFIYGVSKLKFIFHFIYVSVRLS